MMSLLHTREMWDDTDSLGKNKDERRILEYKN